jgi:hypothetical protein
VNEDGSYDFDFHIEENECGFLVNIAVQELVRRGVITLAVEQAEQEVELIKQSGDKLN